MDKVWKIYSNGSNTSNDAPKYLAESVEYHDTWMGEEYVMVTIVTDKSPNPNDSDPFSLEIGDFIEYRGRRYFIYNVPSALKQARKHTYGEAFKYENVKFSSVGMELTEIRFLDIVLGDNKLHYTSLPTFGVYCETVDDLVDRLQANTDREKNGYNSWYFITPNKHRTLDRCIKWDETQHEWVPDTERQAAAETLWNDAFSNGSFLDNEKKNVSVSVDKVSVWDGLDIVKRNFGLNFVLSPTTTFGRVVVIGAMASDTGHDFMYGKGNGLHQIERVADSDQLVVTKLFAYGSDTNLPYHYYAELGRKPYFVVSEKKTETFIVSHPRYILCSTLSFAAIEPYLNGVDNKVTLYVGNQYCTAWCETDGTENNYTRFRLIASLDSNIDFLLFDASKENGRVYISSGVNVNSWPDVEQDEDGLPNNMAVNCLMLPGFPKYALNDVVRCEYVYIENEQIVDQTRFFIRRTPTDTYSTTPSFVVNGNHVLTFSTDRLRPWIKSPNVAEIGVKEGDIHFIDENDDNGLQDIHPSIEGMTEDDVFNNGSSVRLDEIVAVDTITDDGYFADGVSDIPKFTITIRDLGFDLRQAYADAGSSMKLSMKDGYCGGRDFDVKGVTQLSNGQWKLTIERCPDDALELYFPYSDSVAHGGVATQNEPYQIRGSHMEGDVMVSGDHFVLTDILIYDTNYVYAASVEMLKKSVLWIIGNDYTRFTYLPKIDEIFMAKNQDTAYSSQYYELKAGKLMHFEDEDLGIDARIYIDQLTIREGDGVPKYEVTLREDKQVSSIQRMVDKAVSENTTIAGGGNTNYSNRQIQSLIEKYGDEHYLSKTDEDEAAEKIGFIKGLWIKAKGLFGFDEDGNIKANDIIAEGNSSVGGDADIAGNVSVGDKLDVYGVETVNDIKSRSYSGSGLADTGWAITNDNGSGSSQAVFDYLTIRKKMIINSIEIKETHFSAGDVAHTLAEAEIARTDFLYIDQNGNEELLGYSQVKVPWLLRGIALVLGKRFGGVEGVFSHYKKVRLTVTDAEIKRCNRIRCYFLSKDGDHEIENWFRPDDLVRCQTWNVVKEHRDTFTPDFDDHTGNIYYWRKIKDVSYNTGVPRYIAKDAQGNPTNDTTTNVDQAYVNEGGIPRLATNGTYAQNVDDKHSQKVIDGNTYHWFDVEYDYYAEQRGATGSADAYSDIPAAGDKVVQFGNTTDPDRMNIYLIEVNGAGNPDAPDWKIYKGVYTFNLKDCWWGGETCCKTKWSPATGIKAYAPSFEWITEYGVAKQVFTRQEVYWTEIALERDDFTNERSISSYPDYSDDIVDNNGSFVSRGGFKFVNGQKVYGSAQNPIPKNWVRKCRYYEQVTHQGSVWLCSMVESFYWRDSNGNHIASRQEGAEYVRSYTVQEPTSAANDWTEQVEKGDEGAFKSSVFCRTNKDISAYQPQGGTYDNPIPTSTKNAQGVVDGSIVWTDGIPDGDAMLWETTAWFYSNADPAPWTPPKKMSDNESQDVEFCLLSSYTAIPENSPIGADRRDIGWYDPDRDKNRLPSGFTWSDMVWRAERRKQNGEYVGAWVYTRIKGENSVRIDLTNENDSMLYTSGGTLVSGNVTSEAKLYDGSEDVSTSATWTMTAVGCRLSSGNSRNIVVTAMTADTGYVNVQAVYTDKNGTAYTKVTRLTLKKLVDVDKYDLEITPNSIAYNSTKDSPATSTLSIKVWKSTVDGKRVVSNPPTGYSVYVNGSRKTPTTTGTYAFTTDNSEYDTVLVKIANDSDINDILDSETIPITKAEDGKNVVRMDLDNEYDSIQYQGDGTTKVSSGASVNTTVYLFDGITDKSDDVTFSVDTANTTLKSSSYSLSGRVLTVSGCQLTDSSYGDGYVTLKCTYRGTTYRTKFSVGYLLNTDKFDLDVNPNALFLNTSEGWSASKTITVKVMRTPAGGGTPTAVNPSDYGLALSASIGSLGTYNTSTKAFTLTVTQAQATSNNDTTISLYKNGDNTKVYDRETVPFNRAENGTSPYFADIDNEMDSVACDKNGNTLTGYDTTVGVGLWYGSTSIDLDKLETNSITGFTITPNKTAKTIRIQVTQGTNIAEVNTVNITVAGSGSGNRSLHFVLNGVRQGENGEPAILYSLVPSVSAVVKKKDGKYSVNNVSCTRQKNEGGTITDNTTDGSITYKLNGGSEQSYTNNTNIAVSNFTKSIQFIFKVNSKVVDIETIPMVADGKDGVTPTVVIDPNTKHWIVNDEDTGVKAEGENGTGVELKGSVKYYYAASGSPSLQALTGMSTGDCYVVTDEDDTTHGRHLFFFNGGTASNWELNWNDLGEFKGEDGVSSYVHMAWADNVTFKPDGVTYDEIAGFTKDYDGKAHDWIGLCTDSNESDPGLSGWKSYKWNYQKGADGNGFEHVFMRSKKEITPTVLNDDYTEGSKTMTPTMGEYRPAVANYSEGCFEFTRFTDDPLGVCAEWPFEYMAERKAVDGVWQLYANKDVVLHRTYSDSTVSYSLVPSSSELNFRKGDGNTYLPPSYTLSCKVVKMKGSDSYPYHDEDDYRIYYALLNASGFRGSWMVWEDNSLGKKVEYDKEHTLEELASKTSFTLNDISGLVVNQYIQVPCICSDVAINGDNVRIVVTGKISSISSNAITLTEKGAYASNISTNALKATVDRNNVFNDANWNTYGTLNHSETWGNTSGTRGNCKTGDFFNVIGKSTSGKYHVAIYRCTNDSGNLAGVCVSHRAVTENSLTIPNSTTNTSVEFCLSSAASASDVSDENIIDSKRVAIIKDGLNGSATFHEIQSSQASVIVGAESTIAVIDAIFNFRLNSSGEYSAYSCYYAVYRRKGGTYTWKKSSSSKATTGSYSETENDYTTVDAFVVVMSDTAIGSANSLPTSYLDKLEIPVEKQGGQGPAGNDAYSVVIEPTDMLFTQDTTKNSQGVYPLVEATKTATVIVKKGNSNSFVNHTTTIPQEGVVNCRAANSQSQDQIEVTGVIGNYTEGSVTVRVAITNGPTFDLKLNVYYNLLGTWKQSVDAGTETIVAKKISYVINNGDETKEIEQTTQEFNSVRSAAGAFEQWASDYQSSSGQSVNNLNTRISTAEGNINTVTKKVNDGKNMMPVTSGWEDFGGNTSPISYTSEFGILDSDGDLYSPIVTLKANTTYCFSAQFDGNPQTETGYALASASGSYAHNSDVYDRGDAYTPSWQTAADERKYFTFTTGNAEQKFVFNQYFSGNNNIYRPQLEIGSVPTPFDASTMEVSSKIQQTASEIELSITNKLGQTGVHIDGNNRNINLQADKVTFSDAQGGNTDKIYIDPATGTLNAKNAKIENGLYVDRVDILKGRAYEPNTSGAVAKDVYYEFYEVTKGQDLSEYGSAYAGYYAIGEMVLKSNHLFVYTEGIENYTGGTVTGDSYLHLILPPPHLFIGQSIVITNQSFGFLDGNVILEQAYMEIVDMGEHNNDYICFTDKMFIPDTPDYPYGSSSGVTLLECAPYDKSEGLQLLNGIWQLVEYVDPEGHIIKYPSIMSEISLSDYEWLELSAVEGEYKKEHNVNPSKAADFNAVWMITRWEKKQESSSTRSAAKSSVKSEEETEELPDEKKEDAGGEEKEQEVTK